MVLSKLAMTIAALAMTAPSQAARLAYSLTGDYSANWTMDASPTRFETVLLGDFFAVGVTGSFSGMAGDKAAVVFYSPSSFGGVGVRGDIYFAVDTSGPQLYSGPESSPSMLIGTFLLLNEFGRPAYTLKVTSLSAVPEPAGWAMMIVGFGLVGAAMRQRTATVRVNYA